MELIDVKSAKITEKGQIAIPKAARKLKGFEVGDKIAVIAYKDKIELRPLKKFSKRMETAFASEKSLAKDWDKEDEAWEKL